MTSKHKRHYGLPKRDVLPAVHVALRRPEPSSRSGRRSMPIAGIVHFTLLTCAVIVVLSGIFVLFVIAGNQGVGK